MSGKPSHYSFFPDFFFQIYKVGQEMGVMRTYLYFLYF